VRVVQHGLGWDAADVETRAAQLAARLDAGDLEAELRRLDRADVAAGAAANDDQVQRVCNPKATRGRATAEEMSSRPGSSAIVSSRTVPDADEAKERASGRRARRATDDRVASMVVLQTTLLCEAQSDAVRVEEVKG